MPKEKTPYPQELPCNKPRESAWLMRLNALENVLSQRGFAASTVNTLQDAAKLVLGNILPESDAQVVSFGGSMTIVQSGLYDAFKAMKQITLLDTYDYSLPLETMIEIRRQSLLADLYLCSANAITENGTLMLIDGTGNRTAAVQFGPKKVVVIIGRNKLCVNLEDGFERVRKLAAPANAIRLNRKTPCTKTGYCMDCTSPDRICSTWALVQRCTPKNRIHVILVNEEVGY